MAVGCTSLGSFSSRFSDLMGMSPSAYRDRDHGDTAGIPGCMAMVLIRPSRTRRSATGPSSNGEAPAPGAPVASQA